VLVVVHTTTVIASRHKHDPPQSQPANAAPLRDPAAMAPPSKETDALLAQSASATSGQQRASFASFILTFLPLGCVSFGGPTVHVALLHDKYVSSPPSPSSPQLCERTFVELFALASALPGPGSTQLATGLGATFGGTLGAVITLTVWQLPGSLAMAVAGVWFHGHLQAENSVEAVSQISDHAIGLISAAFAIVVLAAVKITASTCRNSDLKMVLCIASASVAVLVPPSTSSWAFGSLLVLSGCAVLAEDRVKTSSASTAAFSFDDDDDDESGLDVWRSGVSPYTGAALIALFVSATAAILLWQPESKEGNLFRTFWITGATVFGGGQVVIPFLLTVIVANDILPIQVFLSGFGLVCVMPGPMYNLSFFLAAALFSWRGAILGAGLFLPGTILVLGILPFWEYVRRWQAFRIFLSGVTAGAAGLIIAGVWMLLQRTLVGPLAFVISIAAGTASFTYRLPSPHIIVVCGIVGALAVSAGIGGPYH
jgi:chromate transporter